MPRSRNQHLAARYVAEGHTGYQRDVLVAQQDARRVRVLATRAGRRARSRPGGGCGPGWWGCGSAVGLLAYGYRPWRAAWWLLGIIAAAILSVGRRRTYPGRRHRPARRVPPRGAAGWGRLRTAAPPSTLGLALRLSVPADRQRHRRRLSDHTTRTDLAGGSAAGRVQPASRVPGPPRHHRVAGYAGIIRRL
jgi:hypothetical protein